MKKRYLIIILAFCFISLALMTSCSNKNQINNIDGLIKQARVHSVETENYAIYPSNIIENSIDETRQYSHFKRYADIKIPQIYYADDLKDAYLLQRDINKKLFYISSNSMKNKLIKRDNRHWNKCIANYEITKAEEDFFSVKYYSLLALGGFESVYLNGATINTKTGDLEKLEKFISVDADIITKIKDGSIKYHIEKIKNDGIIYRSDTEYKKDFIISEVEKFIANYKENSKAKHPVFCYIYSCYYINEDFINLIVPVQHTDNNGIDNNTYIILEIPR
ncbi:hypothetical protein LJC10_05350 [Selenomonadales bacterium OttesenSCG-928-I06]|nr:hypothetical protein [Selenomonadales bacterium OttesenSCG-928-I06]